MYDYLKSSSFAHNSYSVFKLEWNFSQDVLDYIGLPSILGVLGVGSLTYLHAE